MIHTVKQINAKTGEISFIEYDDGETDPTAEEIAAAELDAERAAMICSRLQARLALGAVTCAALDAMADDAETPWALAQTLKYAQTWHRLHETMDEIGWALDYTAEEIDALFRVAMTL